MKIKFNNGAIQTTRGDVGCLFVAAGLAHEIFDAPPARPVRWSVYRSDHSLKLYIRAELFSEVQLWTGPTAVADANRHKFHGETVPDALAEEYERARRGK